MHFARAFLLELCQIPKLQYLCQPGQLQLCRLALEDHLHLQGDTAWLAESALWQAKQSNPSGLAVRRAEAIRNYGNRDI